MHYLHLTSMRNAAKCICIKWRSSTVVAGRIGALIFSTRYRQWRLYRQQDISGLQAPEQAYFHLLLILEYTDLGMRTQIDIRAVYKCVGQSILKLVADLSDSTNIILSNLLHIRHS